MKIKTIEPIAVSLPMKKPVQMAGETVTRADNVLVRIESDDGVVGWGEAASAPTMTGETVASMTAAVELLTPGLLKRPPTISPALRRRWRRGSMAIAAPKPPSRSRCMTSSAAPPTGRFMRSLAGGSAAACRCSPSSARTCAADLREAKERWAAGYRAFKIKVGLASASADAERTRAVCLALKGMGEPCLVSADANQGFGVDDALVYVRMLGDCGLDFFEQPVEAHDLDGMARVAAASRVPIGADEGLHSADDIVRHHERKAARGGSLKAIKLGGLRALFEASRLCDRLGMKINISCKTGELSVASAAAAHVAAAVPALDWGLTVTNPGLAEDVVVEPLAVMRGHVDVPERPGLGIEVDERRVRRWQQEFSARKVA